MRQTLDFPTPGWCASWRKPDRRPIYEWATDHVTLPPSYPPGGKFAIGPNRHLIEPFEAAQDPKVREVTCAAAVQTGKTLWIEVCGMWFMVNDPGPGMWTLQTDSDAKQHWKERYFELLKSTPAIRAMLPSGYDLTQGAIYFGPFFWVVNGANTNNLQRVSIRYKLNSEVWLWRGGLLEHARARVTKFEEVGTSKILNESQGSFAGDDFDRAWQAGHQGVWSAKCAGCGHHQPLSFFARGVTDPRAYCGVTWADDARQEDGDWNVSRVAETARWRCPECGHEVPDEPATFAQWNESGRYIACRPTAPAHIRSFRWEALVSRSIKALAVQWTEACNQKRRGVMQGIIDFKQKRCGLAYDESQEDFGGVVELTSSGYTLAEIEKDPAKRMEGEKFRFMTIDRQKDHWWVVIRVWFADGSSRLIFCGKMILREEMRAKQQTYGVSDALTFEDAQYDTDAVYDDCAEWNWTALHGSPRNGFEHQLPNNERVTKFFSTMRYAAHKGKRIRYALWASDPVKDTLHRLYSGRGVPFEAPDDVPDVYRNHMKSETKRETIDKQTGRRTQRWVVVSGRQNHLRDCEAEQVAVAYMLNLLTIEKHEKPATETNGADEDSSIPHRQPATA